MQPLTTPQLSELASAALAHGNVSVDAPPGLGFELGVQHRRDQRRQLGAADRLRAVGYTLIRGTEPGACPVQQGGDRAALHPEHLADLVVGQALVLPERQGCALGIGEGQQGLKDVAALLPLHDHGERLVRVAVRQV